MSYRAKVVKVMIASPSDIVGERQAVRNIVQEWNYAHSEDKNIVLMPVGWDSHSAPAMGARPQAIINKQVLKDCDLLVAAFWTKLGMPTGKALSGTVEEIEEHIKARKPAMIYFSSMPVMLESVDQKQYQALLEFKAQLRERGLYAEYDSPDDFRDKFSRQLAQTVIRHFASKKTETSKSLTSRFRVHLSLIFPNRPVLSWSRLRRIRTALSTVFARLRACASKPMAATSLRIKSQEMSLDGKRRLRS